MKIFRRATVLKELYLQKIDWKRPIMVLLAVVMVFTMVSTFSSPAKAWKPTQHVGLGNIILEDLSDGNVNIDGTDYTVNSLVAEAILRYPKYYLMGTIGPDAYPDIYFGQWFIHPDNGQYWADQWLQYLLQQATKEYSRDGGKALAFAYGFITHAAGDMWIHTLVNKYAGGAWPGVFNDPKNCLRHMLIEKYIDNKTGFGADPFYNDPQGKEAFLNDTAFHYFLYKTFITSDFSRSHSESLLFWLFLPLRDWLADQNWYWPLNYYRTAWIEDIDYGLLEWTRTSSRIALTLFVEKQYGEIFNLLTQWGTYHGLSMLGVPDSLLWIWRLLSWINVTYQDIINSVINAIYPIPFGATLNTIPTTSNSGLSPVPTIIYPLTVAYLYGWFSLLFEHAVNLLGYWIFEQVFGLTVDELEEKLKDPETWLTTKELMESAPFGLDTLDMIDKELAPSLSGPYFDPYKFDMTHNTIVMSKLLLLDGPGLNNLLANYGIDPLYSMAGSGTAWSTDITNSPVIVESGKTMQANVTNTFIGPISVDIEVHINGIDADTPEGPHLLAGELLQWEYIVTNTGSTALTNITVVDDQAGPISLPTTSLERGASMTVIENGIALIGQYVSTTTVTASGDGTTVSDSDSCHYLGIAPSGPSIDIEKHINGVDSDTPMDFHILKGEPLLWQYIVTNTGNTTLTNIIVTDNQTGVISFPTPELKPGLSMVEIASGTANTTQYGSTANVTAYSGTTMVYDEDKCYYYGDQIPSPSIDIEKHINGTDADTPDGLHVLVGAPIKWEYIITNMGNVTLTNIIVTDNQTGVINLLKTSLEPGFSITGTATGEANANLYVSTANVTASANTTMISDEDKCHYFGHIPGALQVNHIVDWLDVIPDPMQMFEITVAGPSYPDGNTKKTDYDGEVLLWENLLPGQYAITKSEAIQRNDTNDLANDPAGMCAMLGFLRSMDGNHQWMEYTPSLEKAGTGQMRMWDGDGGIVTESVFKKIFHIGLDMEITPSLDIIPGSTGVYDIEVKNTGNMEDRFTLYVSGLPDTWSCQLSHNPVVVKGGTSEHVSLSVQPYRDYQTTPGDYPFKVSGISQRGRTDWERYYDLIPSKEEHANVNVLPYYEPDVFIVPEYISIYAGSTGVYTIVLENKGNTSEVFNISLDFPSSYYNNPPSIQPDWTSLGMTSISLEPSASAETTLSITIPYDWIGERMTTYEVNVIATSLIDPTATDMDSSKIAVVPIQSSGARSRSQPVVTPPPVIVQTPMPPITVTVPTPAVPTQPVVITPPPPEGIEIPWWFFVALIGGIIIVGLLAMYFTQREKA